MTDDTLLRTAIWNACRDQGLGQDRAIAIVSHVMAGIPTGAIAGVAGEAARMRARKAITDRYYAGGKVIQMTPVKPAELVDLVIEAISGPATVVLRTMDGVIQDPASDDPANQLGHFAATAWMRAEIAERRADRAVAVLREIASNDSDGLEVFTPQAMHHKARMFIEQETRS